MCGFHGNASQEILCSNNSHRGNISSLFLFFFYLSSSSPSLLVN
jgi:hypothetical protein